MHLKKYLWGFLFGGLLFAFTSYLLLDTFVIVRRYETVETAAQSVITVVSEAMAQSETVEVEPTSAATAIPTAAPTAEAVTVSTSAAHVVSTDTTYRDENISVQLTEYRISDTTVYVADVQVSSPEYLKTAFAQGTYGRNVTAKVSETADAVNAVLAINGDYYGARQSGYVIREGVLYRDKAVKNAVDLVIYGDGSFGVGQSCTRAQAMTFGPALIEDGEISVSVNDEVGRAMASNPRTAIAVVDDLHYLFVVSDGRTSQSEGLTLYELATFLKTLGAKTAYNLDGGGSSTMVFNGTIVNVPTSSGKSTKERSVSDIVYIGY